MASDHPFQLLFETLGRVPASHAESVNRQAYEVLSDILRVPVEKSGRCILLRAPRAGHGKTHLLSRVQHHLGADHEFIPLHASFGCRIDSGTVTDDALRRLVRQLPASGGLTILDLVTRRLFASALQPLVGSGEVPCQDREGALTALRARPIETFDFHHPNAVTAQWARENFEVLGQRLSHELAQRAGLPIREVAFWVETLFRFASTPLENPNRIRALADAVSGGSGADLERLEALLGLLTMLTRVVLVADDLEGFSTDETAALRLASFLGALRQSVERLDVILSVNKDIWESAFVPRLSGGLADRLSEVVVELEPLTETEMAALLDSRVPGLGQRVLEKVDRSKSGTHARGLIQAAGMAWLKATATDSAPPVAVEATPPPPPVEIPLPVIEEVAAPEPVQEPQSFSAEPPEAAPEQPLAKAEPLANVVSQPVESFNGQPEQESPFTIAAEQAPAPSQEVDSWPAPEFKATAPEPVAVTWTAPEQPVFVANTNPEQPFQAPAVESSAEAAWQPGPAEVVPAVEEIAPENAWNPPHAVAVEVPEPEPYQPQIDSPFQIAAQEAPASPAAFVPATPEPQPEPFQPVLDSPFQIAAEQADTTYSQAPPQTFFPPQEFQAAPVFQAESPPQPPAFQAAPPYQTPAAPEQPAAQNFFQPGPAEPQFQPSPEPAPAIQPPPDSGFSPASAPAGSPPPGTSDTDRVDDLLRQFRERYGRGSL